MFVGHYALAFASKPLARHVSLGTLFLACELADLIWPCLVLLGIEKVAIAPGFTPVTPLVFVSYPWSHSLLAMLAWAVIFAGLLHMVRRPGRTAILVVAGLVVSHWVLDALSHVPDMPLTVSGPTKVGLGLWESRAETIAVELPLFLIGVGLYTHFTSPKDRTGRFALIGLVVFLIAVYFANLFGPPPPSETALGWSAQAQWLLVAWGYWVDRHRSWGVGVPENP